MERPKIIESFKRITKRAGRAVLNYGPVAGVIAPLVTGDVVGNPSLIASRNPDNAYTASLSVGARKAEAKEIKVTTINAGQERLNDGCDDVAPGSTERVECPTLEGPLVGKLVRSAYWVSQGNADDIIAGIDDRRMQNDVLGGDQKGTYFFGTVQNNSDGRGYRIERWNTPATGNEERELTLTGTCDEKADVWNGRRNRWEYSCVIRVTDKRISSNDGRVLEQFPDIFVRLCPPDQIVASEWWQYRWNDQNVQRKPYSRPLVIKNNK